tara:strand:- start:604 stop:855 length:252 start_codon:yes stop_codon:yes gene_type:complete
MYEIEKNVKIPPVRGKWTILASQMEPGDSVVVANALEGRTLQQAIVNYWNKQNRNFNRDVHKKNTKAIARARKDETYRVWRVT